MGYTANGSLADLFPESFVDSAAPLIVRRCVDDLREDVAIHTPVAKIPQAYGGDRRSWIEDRGGRRPGTARRSWKATEPLEERPDYWTASVETDDEVMPYIEDDTRPHIIRPRLKKALRFPAGATFRLAKKVKHPGTQGVHMMRDGLARLELTWPATAERVLEELAQAENRRP